MKTKVKAGLAGLNHNETLVKVKSQPQGLKVKSHIKAGRQSNYSYISQDIN